MADTYTLADLMRDREAETPTLGGGRPALADITLTRREPALGQHNLLHRGLSSFGQPALDITERAVRGEAAPKDVAWEYFVNGPIGPFGAVRIPNPIRVYHGGPHAYNAERLVRRPDGTTDYLVGAVDRLPDVPAGVTVLEDFPLGRPRLDRVGTGEGAQAYGHGWYAAEAEAVGRGYRDRLSAPPADSILPPGSISVAGQAFQARTMADLAANAALVSHRGDFDRAVTSLERKARNFGGEYADAARVVRTLQERGATFDPNQGRMYEANLHARPEQFLDWDRPFHQQNDALQQAFRSARQAGHPSRAPRTQEEASLLAEHGIPGLRYLDQGSRGAGEGTRNYVVFNPEIVEILRRYGIIAAPTGAALASGFADQPP